jgi:hypothetical protein
MRLCLLALGVFSEWLGIQQFHEGCHMASKWVKRSASHHGLRGTEVESL